MHALAPLALMAALSAIASAQSSLTTSFAGNNSGGNGTTMFFDLTATGGVEITSFDCNFTQAAGNPCGLNVYIRAGSYVGSQLNPTGWSLVATDTGGVTTAGRGQPTNVPLTVPICIPAGASVALALESLNGSGHAYITGTGSNQNYSNADLTLDAGSAGTSPVFGGGLNDPRVFSGAIHYILSPGCNTVIPTILTGVAEQTPGSTPLSSLPNQAFEPGWNLRLNLEDPGGASAGRFGAFVLNAGVGAAPLVGATPTIPGFQQVWAGSNPAGLATVFSTIVGAPDLILGIPPGVFGAGDVIRFQGLVLDRAIGAAGRLPVLPSSNTMSFSYRAPLQTCIVEEDFDGVPTVAGNYPAGWSNGAGTQQWRPNSSGTTSATTGPTSARSGSQYMYTETSSPVAVGDVFELRSDTYTDPTATNLNFFLSRIGSDIGQLEVFLDDGTSLTPLAVYAGPNAGQSQGSVEWSDENLALPSPLPASYSFLFRYTTQPVVQFTFYGDCAIDRFCLN